MKKLFFLFFLFLPWMSGFCFENQHIPKFCFLWILAVSFFVFMLFKHFTCFTIQKQDFLCLIFFVFCILHLFFVENTASAGERFCSWACFLSFYFLFSMQKQEILYSGMVGFFIGCSLASVYGLIQSLDPVYVQSYPAFVATFGNVSFAAECMVVCFWIGFLGLSKSNKTIRFVGCLLNLLYLVRCSSRASWIALFLGLVVYYVLSYFWKQRLSRYEKVLPILSCILIGIVIFSIPVLRNTVQHKVSSLLDWKQGSISVRLSLWKSTTCIVQNQPFFGIGMGQFQHVYPMVRENQEYLASQGRIVSHPHNSWLLIASEQGIFCCILFLFAVLYVFYQFYQQKQALFFAVLSSLFVFTLVSMPFQNPILLLAWAYLFSRVRKQENAFNLCPSIQKICLLIGAIVSICCCIFSLYWVISDYLYVQGKRECAQGRFSSAISSFSLSYSLHKQGNYLLEWGRALYFDRQYSKAVDCFNNVIRKYPEYEGGYIDVGLCFVQQNDILQAIRIWQQGLALFPVSPALNYNVLECYRQLKEPIALALSLQQWVQKQPNIIEDEKFQVYQGILAEFEKKSLESIYCYTQILEKNKKNAEAAFYLGKSLLYIDENAGLFHLQKAIEYGTPYIKMRSYCQIGYYYEQKNNLQFAAIYYLKAKNENPYSALPFLHLAQIALYNQKTEQALKYFQNARSIGGEKILLQKEELTKIRTSSIVQNLAEEKK